MSLHQRLHPITAGGIVERQMRFTRNIDFLKRCHEPYVIITSGDCVYKMDYNEVLDYHISKKADITVVCGGYGTGRR